MVEPNWQIRLAMSPRINSPQTQDRLVDRSMALGLKAFTVAFGFSTSNILGGSSMAGGRFIRLSGALPELARLHRQCPILFQAFFFVFECRKFTNVIRQNPQECVRASCRHKSDPYQTNVKLHLVAADVGVVDQWGTRKDDCR